MPHAPSIAISYCWPTNTAVIPLLSPLMLTLTSKHASPLAASYLILFVSLNVYFLKSVKAFLLQEMV